MCPMRFNKFPLDEHTCKFMIGSTNYDDTRMRFDNYKLDYDPSAGNTILDYQVIKCTGKYWSNFLLLILQVTIEALQPKDRTLVYGEAGNYSLTGFEMTLTRNVAKYNNA